MGTIYYIDKIGEDASVRLITGGLNKGHIVVIPTDTLYGISCAVFRPDTLNAAENGELPWIWRSLAARLSNIKGRKGPFLILARDWQWAGLLTEKPVYPHNLPTGFETGRPVTYIFQASSKLVNPYSGGGKIAIRVPDDRFLQRILKEVPLISSTSANVSGAPTPTAFEEIGPEIISSSDILLNAPTGDNRSSVIVDLTGPEPVIVRS